MTLNKTLDTKAIEDLEEGTTFLNALVKFKTPRDNVEDMRLLLNNTRIQKPHDIISVTAIMNTCSGECISEFLSHETTRKFFEERPEILIFFFKPYKSYFLKENYTDPTKDTLCIAADKASEFAKTMLSWFR